MNILGINASFHDSAAVLLRDGEVVAAAEEERFCRVKHTKTAPTRAIRFCLAEGGLTLPEVDWVALNVEASCLEREERLRALSDRPYVAKSAAEVVARRAGGLLDGVDPARIWFVPHHTAHAASAVGCSGFDEALVFTPDGYGDDEAAFAYSSGLLLSARRMNFTRLLHLDLDRSLGSAYTQVTQFIGFRRFDEYKMMGLAPYGDRERFRSGFAACYALNEDGSFELDRPALVARLHALAAPGPVDGGIPQVHKDIAAACQEMLETIVLHVLTSAGRKTGLRHLALAGGVALNCTANGKILASGAFDDVFVQPAASDQGGALGAALYVHGLCAPAAPKRLQSVSWGSAVPSGDALDRIFARWEGFVDARRVSDIAATAAGHIARGDVVGWVQGRAEFGPRALGNRSILADPRPADNREIVNRIVKKREAFRPFAPAVLEEKLDEYFEVPGAGRAFPFMTFVLPVREAHRGRLAAVTHVDGTARVQTISRAQDPLFWDLVQAFGELTGVYMVLNTSFNNSAEPIVDSVDDAIVTFLTTGLPYLVVGDRLVRKCPLTDDLVERLTPRLMPLVRVEHIGSADRFDAFARYDDTELSEVTRRRISAETFDVLRRMDGRTTLGELAGEIPDRCARGRVLDDVRDLWWHRMVDMSPSPPRAERIAQQSGFEQRECSDASFTP